MNKYSFDAQAFVLSDHFNRDILVCENYFDFISLGCELSERPEDDFLVIEQGIDPIHAHRATVRVDFTNHPSGMWEGAFILLHAILATDKSIGDVIMKAIKNHEYATFTADLKTILEPDEVDEASLSKEDFDDYFGIYNIEINPQLAKQED